MFVVHPHYKPGDGPTTALVASLVAKVDKRRKVSPEALSDVVCGCLALRGVKFRINHNKWSNEHKKAAEAVKDTLVGSLLKRKGQWDFEIHPSLGPSFVVDRSEPNLRFRVQNQHCRWTNTASVPSADLVGTINGHKAVKLEMPNVAKTFEHLYQDGGQQLDLRFETVPLDIEVGLIAKDHARRYRGEITYWALKHGWVAVLIEDGDVDTYTFAVTDTHSEESTEFVATWTRDWFGKQMSASGLKGLPWIKFPSVVYHPSYTSTVPGFQILRHLENSSARLKAASNA